VGRLVVVDNHSSEGELKELRILAEKHDFSLIENPDNYGVGTALNQSIAWAKGHAECEFILFFDQDSFISESFVAEMVAEYRRHAESERIFLVVPKIVHRRTGVTCLHRTFQGKHLVAQTSGSLMPIQVFVDEGLYREDLFIDLVDYEFCLRVAAHGWRIGCCKAAVLYHEPGNVKQMTVLGIVQVTTYSYSPLRKYYSMRNGIWTIKTYGLLYRGWASDHAYAMLKDVMRTLLFEKNRYASILMWVRAVMDVLRSRLGRYPRSKDRAGSANLDRGLSGGSVLPQPKMAETRRSDEQTSTQEPHGGVKVEDGLGRDPRREDAFGAGRAV
jgi:rhamnosyltransferase